MSSEDLEIDEWLKDVAPSGALRKWFGHEPEKWEEFKKRYFEELKTKDDLLGKIEAVLEKREVTFVYAAKDEKFNNAVALKEYMEKSK